MKFVNWKATIDVNLHGMWLSQRGDISRSTPDTSKHRSSQRLRTLRSWITGCADGERFADVDEAIEYNVCLASSMSTFMSGPMLLLDSRGP